MSGVGGMGNNQEEDHGSEDSNTESNEEDPMVSNLNVVECKVWRNRVCLHLASIYQSFGDWRSTFHILDQMLLFKEYSIESLATLKDQLSGEEKQEIEDGDDDIFQLDGQVSNQLFLLGIQGRIRFSCFFCVYFKMPCCSFDSILNVVSLVFYSMGSIQICEEYLENMKALYAVLRSTLRIKRDILCSRYIGQLEGLILFSHQEFHKALLVYESLLDEIKTSEESVLSDSPSSSQSRQNNNSPSNSRRDNEDKDDSLLMPTPPLASPNNNNNNPTLNMLLSPSSSSMSSEGGDFIPDSVSISSSSVLQPPSYVSCCQLLDEKDDMIWMREVMINHAICAFYKGKRFFSN